MPFAFSRQLSQRLPAERRCVEDRRNNPVRGRRTQFRLLQQNMLGYTFAEFIPGFAEPGINTLPFRQVIERPTENARLEGELLFGGDFVLTGSQIAKVEGDIFEKVEAAIHWNIAARWNRLMVGEEWPAAQRLPRPGATPHRNRQVAVLSLPRRYDWVRLLVPAARRIISELREELAQADLTLPTSTPDLVIAALPEEYQDEEMFRTELRDLGPASQRVLDGAYRNLEDSVAPGEIVLAIALKKSLRSDRLYQPLYEANIMQLLLEGRLGAPQVDFEVHTLDATGTGADRVYTAASLSTVTVGHANPHRAVRDLYVPDNAQELARRFLAFLATRMDRVPPPIAQLVK